MTSDSSDFEKTLTDPQLHLEASTGYDPYHQEMRDMLGTFSVAAAQIEAGQEEVNASQANVLLLQKVADILPHVQKGYRPFKKYGVDLGVFGFANTPDRDQQYLARQTQSHVVWLKHDDLLGVDDLTAHFVVGRRENPDSPETTSLLLLPAVKPDGARDLGYRRSERMKGLKIATVRKDDMKLRDELVAILAEQEYSESEQEAMINKKTGMFEVHSGTPGSTTLARSKGRFIGKASRERMLENGVRLVGDVRWVNEGLDQEDLTSYDVWPTLMRVVRAFRIADEVDTLLENGETWQPATRERLLEEQNLALKSRLTTIMMASGFTPEEVAQKLSEDFPTV
jgi:hypothetical protein